MPLSALSYIRLLTKVNQEEERQIPFRRVRGKVKSVSWAILPVVGEKFTKT